MNNRELDFIDECYIDDDLSILEKLTLIIPTYDRNYYLSRCLWYHAHFPFGKIIVADSSHEKKRVINKETVSNIQKQFDIDIIYLEYETESDPHGRDIFQKWGDAVMHVDTDYSIITTDKQFTIPNILSSGIRFLEENDDYVSIDFTKCRIQVSSNQYPIVYIDQIFTEGKISMDSPISRYETLCNQSGINAQLFAIYKTQTQKQMYNHISKLDIRFAEIYLNVSSAIYGKIMIVTELIAICRDLTFLYDNRGNVHLEESSTMRYPTLSEYKLSGVYNKYYNKFKNELIETFLEQGITLSETKIDNLLSMLYTQNGLSTHTSIIRRIHNTAIVQKIWKIIPKDIKQIIKTVVSFEGEILSTPPSYLLMISKYINNSLHLYEKDEPII